MNYLVELLKILLPAAAVLYGMYLVVISFLSKEQDKMKLELRNQQQQVVLPIRLQAAERLCLLLDRISPAQVIRRAIPGKFSAEELHHHLISEIREEFNHNASQQVYFSEDTWDAVRIAVEEVISRINVSRQQLNESASGVDLAKVVLTQSFDRQNDPVALAVRKIKAEVSLYF